MNLLSWLNISKGLAILWIVFFHLFNTYSPGVPSPISKNFIAEVVNGDGWQSPVAAFHTVTRIVAYGLIGLGFHGVGLFLVVIGCTLKKSCVRQAAKGKIEWLTWYRKKFFRLFPMYWAAHLVYLAFCLASYLTGRTLIDQLEPLDNRLLYSLSGLRFINIDSNFFYINAAWWYFTMLIQLYFIFPLLFIGLQRLGVIRFLLGACTVGLGVRYLMLSVAPNHEALWAFSNGMMIQGGFALSRLPEFAVGMAMGIWHQKQTEAVEKFLLDGRGLILSLVTYPFALTLYHIPHGYIFVDLCTGLCFFLLAVGIAGLIGRISWLSWMGQALAICGTYSYGIYLIHQPHMIFLGKRIEDLSPLMFVPVALAGIVAVSLWGIGFEKLVNFFINMGSAPQHTGNSKE